MNRADETIRRQLDELPAPDFPLTPEQQQQILAMACRKAGVTPRAAGPAAPAAAEKPRRRVLRTVLIAAAIACVGTATVFAAPALLRMLQGELPFFQSARTQSQVSDPLEAPRGSYDGARQQLEAYNAQVGQTVESAGISVTLDNVAMDVSGMDAFFTIRGGDTVQALLDAAGMDPTAVDWASLGLDSSFWRTTMNGDEAALEIDQGDYYLNEDGSIRLWEHYLLNTLPAGDEITVTMTEDRLLQTEGEWTFTVTLDGASVRAGGQTVEAGSYDLGQDITITTEELKEYGQSIDASQPITVHRPLNLLYLSFGPLGGNITVQVPQEGYSDQQLMVNAGIPAEMLSITDNTGKTLYASCVRGFGETQRRNLTLPDPAATSLTLTPVVCDRQNSQGEERTLTMAEMQNGAKIATSELGGYTVQNFMIQDHAISYELVPYGWTGGDAGQLYPDDEGVITMVEEQADVLNDDSSETYTIYRSGALHKSVDRATGTITVRYDYYAATKAELEQIPTFHYTYISGYSLDTSHAVTLPLQPVE